MLSAMQHLCLRGAMHALGNPPPPSPPPGAHPLSCAPHVLRCACWCRFELSGVGVHAGSMRVSLAALKAGRWGAVLQRQATLQCAGNRRSEMCAVKLVEGRAPWNHGEWVCWLVGVVG